MKIKKLHLQLAIGFVVLAALFSVWNASRSSRTGPGGQPPNPQPLIVGAPGQPARSSVQVVDPASIPPPPAIDTAPSSSVTRDPFLFGSESRDVIEAAMAMQAGADPVVRMILFSASRRLALVDNKMVGIGDQIGSFRVVDIERNAVVFQAATGERRRVSTQAAVQQGASR